MQKIKRIFEAFVLALSGLLVVFGLAWWLLAQVNFSYSYWHDYDGMAEAVNRLSAENRYKQGFEKTTKEQRADLFAQIMTDIHADAANLESITFTVPGHPPQQLLREPEVVHLQDVANLIDVGRRIVFAALVVWLGMWAYFVYAKRKIPSLIAQFSSALAFVALSAAVVMAIGPIPVFYQLHIWIFPEGHQWYFFFQESLMATMMYAPYLFGWIAVEWLALSLVIFLLLQTLVAFVVKRWGYSRGGQAD